MRPAEKKIWEALWGEIGKELSYTELAVSTGLSPRGLSVTLKSLVNRRKIYWQSHLVRPGIFDTDQVFVITPLSENRVKFSIHGRHSGLLVPFFWYLIKKYTPLDYDRMNEALKIRAEGYNGTNVKSTP